jgi:NADH-quinone oxidoreductase subunit J
MEITFYLSALIAVVATALAITRLHAVHALLFLIVSLLALAIVFFIMGAHFAAALEVIIYAGAIMVLFIFAIMMLSLGKETMEWERQLLKPRIWALPTVLTVVLFAELVYLLTAGHELIPGEIKQVSPVEVGAALFGPYILGVEMAAFLLMAGLVGAYHIGRREKKIVHRYLQKEKS